MNRRSWLPAVLLSFFLHGVALAAVPVCDPGYSLVGIATYSCQTTVWPSPTHPASYDPYTLIDNNGNHYVVQSPTATGYVAPAPATPASVTDLASRVSFAGVGGGLLVIASALIGVLVLLFLYRVLVAVVWAQSPAGRLESRNAAARSAQFRQRAVRRAYSGLRSPRRG